jgi:hypothetical protein
MIRTGNGAQINLLGVAKVTGAGGYCIATTGSGITVVNNGTGTAAEATNTNARAIHHNSTGNLTVTGNLISSGTSSYAVYVGTSAVGITIGITGTIAASGANAVGYGQSGNSTATITGNGTVSATAEAAVSCSAGTVTYNGDVAASGGYGLLVSSTGAIVHSGKLSSSFGASELGCAAYVNGGTLTWTGARSLAAGEYCFIKISTGTLNFATGAGALTLTCSGSFVLAKEGAGTITLTSGANNASFIRYVAAAQIAGNGVDISSYLTGPTLPTEAQVEDAVNYGYAGTLLTGELAGGGYTYGDEDPSYVLTTATGAGTLDLSLYTLISNVVAAAYVIEGHDNYTGGDAGTYHEATTTEVQDGVTFGAAEALTGTYDPMAAAVFPAAANVSDVETAYGPTGAEYAGSLDLSLYVLTSNVVDPDYVIEGHDNYTGGAAGTYHEADVTEVEDGVMFGPGSTYEGSYLGGGTTMSITFG